MLQSLSKQYVKIKENVYFFHKLDNIMSLKHCVEQLNLDKMEFNSEMIVGFRWLVKHFLDLRKYGISEILAITQFAADFKVCYFVVR